MKANEAPKEIYFSEIENGTHYYTEGIPFEREYVKYIKKDAFIEKACSILKDISCPCAIIEQFKNRIR